MAHYWTFGMTSFTAVHKVALAGPDYPYEDVVCSAWLSIPKVYLPENFQAGTKYDVVHERYRGVPPGRAFHSRPDILVIRISLTEVLPARPSLAPGAYSTTERDVLWIECKPPSHNIPSGWNALLSEAIERLSNSHPNRRLYLILAVGMRWIPLLWDPESPPNGVQLKLKADKGEDWNVDSRIRMIDPSRLTGQREITRNHRGAVVIDTHLAYDLKFWNADGEMLGNTGDMLLVETFFNLVQISQFNGVNNTEFK